LSGDIDREMCGIGSARQSADVLMVEVDADANSLTFSKTWASRAYGDHFSFVCVQKYYPGCGLDDVKERSAYVMSPGVGNPKPSLNGNPHLTIFYCILPNIRPAYGLDSR
jgi:hypothetical protein